MYVIGFVIIAAMGAGLIFQDRKIQKLRALRRIDRAKYKEAQLTKAQHDRASLRVSEALRQELRSKELQLRKEQQTKQCFKRACEKLKSRLDDTADEVESLRSALDSANGTIREMMERRTRHEGTHDRKPV
jgi:hypothetical protein